MRQAVREHNIYRWAGLLLSELERIPEGSAVNHSTTSAMSSAAHGGPIAIATGSPATQSARG